MGVRKEYGRFERNEGTSVGLYIRFSSIFLGFMLIVIIGGFISGEIIGFGRSNSVVTKEIESPESFWLNSFAWFGFLVVSVFAGVKLLIKEIKGIKNS